MFISIGWKMKDFNFNFYFNFIFRKMGAGPALPSEDPPSASPGNAHSQVLGVCC
jgi:hypothetical protein